MPSARRERWGSAGQSRAASAARLFGAAGILVAAALLAGCAAEPDATASRAALKEVAETAEDTAASDALDAFDAELHPEPTVEPIECSPHLVITARGTAEPKKKQLLGPVARGIAEARPDDVTILDLDYPADTEVLAGSTLGARTLVDSLNVQAEACPDQRFVLLGYSQGALIIGDALAAPDARIVGGRVGELTEDAAERIDAVVFYGDPRFVGSEPTGYGDFDPELNGLLPRPPGSLDRYADRLRDYCVAGDFICQSTLSPEEAGHVAYYDNGMQLEGAAYAISHLPPRKDSEARDSEAQDPDARDSKSQDPDAQDPESR